MSELGMLAAGFLSAQLLVDLAGPVQPSSDPWRRVHPFDVVKHLDVTNRPARRRSTLGGVVARRGDLAAVPGQHFADRLDPESVRVIVDEADHHGSRGSSSVAKKLDAASRISFARFSSRFSRSSSLIRAGSAVPQSR